MELELVLELELVPVSGSVLPPALAMVSRMYLSRSSLKVCALKGGRVGVVGAAGAAGGAALPELGLAVEVESRN
jgi:hypothetical protein